MVRDVVAVQSHFVRYFFILFFDRLTAKMLKVTLTIASFSFFFVLTTFIQKDPPKRELWDNGLPLYQAYPLVLFILKSPISNFENRL